MPPTAARLEQLRTQLRPELMAVRAHVNHALAALGAERPNYGVAQHELAGVLTAVPHLMKIFDELAED